MKTKKWTQYLPIEIEEAWTFFSRPENLKLITPPELNLHLTTPISDMYEGMFIHYTITPFLSIPFYWTTEITHISKYNFFIDEQRTGPYKIWHHEHHFKRVSEGVEMTDLLSYDIGYSFLGKLVDKWMISVQIDHIFEFRTKVLKSMFA